MKAYLTFARRKEDDVHMLGIDNPTNICDILDNQLFLSYLIIKLLLYILLMLRAIYIK